MTMRRSALRELRAAARAKAEAHSDERLDIHWHRLLNGFVQPCRLTQGRLGRYAGAAWRWARLLAPRRPSRAYAFSTDMTAFRPPAISLPAVLRSFSASARAFQTDPTLHAPVPGLHLASARPAAAARSRAAVEFLVVNQEPRRISRLGRRCDRRDQPGVPARSPRRRSCSLPKRVLQAIGRSFLGAPRGSWEVLYNAVDVEHFTPAAALPPKGPVLLLAGDQTQAYRLELALRTLAEVVRSHPDARLLITGRLVSTPKPLVAELGLEGRVEFLGGYTQRAAPDIYRRAHLLLHTKVKDPCPSAVIEAMACGLPVVCPASGGTLELSATRRAWPSLTRTYGNATNLPRHRRSRRP